MKAFRLDRYQRYLIFKDWVSNGHWAVKKSACKLPALKRLLTMHPGNYNDLSVNEPEEMNPKFESQIRQFIKFDKATPVLKRLDEKDGKALVFWNGEKKIGINEDYEKLITLGDELHCEDPYSPIGIFKQGELQAVLMPYKLTSENQEKVANL